ncbi:MAG: RpoL/Rpb11 RNA polymerase subunit family protein [Candidatus Hermodarchaeota archaeon]
MAKKKAVKPEEKEEEEMDEFAEELLEDSEMDDIYPKLKEKKETKSKPTSLEETIDEEELEFELEEEARFPDYKYLNLRIKKGSGENDYELFIEGQSHGFCNILIKHLLDIEGVNIAAYKYTKIEPATIFIRLEKKCEIKDILHKGIELLREEVSEVQKLFKKLT